MSRPGTHLHMTTDDQSSSAPRSSEQQRDARRGLADAVVTQMYADGRLDGLVAQLRHDYGRLPRHRLEEAVLDAFVALYRRLLAEDVEAPVAFAYKTARNMINKELDRTPALVALPDDDNPGAIAGGQLDDGHDEVRAMRRDHAFRYLLGVVGSWTNSNVKQVTQLVIEAATHGEPLEAPEIASRLGLNPNSVRKWKQRGLDRLAAHVEALELDLADFGEEAIASEGVGEKEDDPVE